MAKKINIALILSLMCANSFAKYPEDVFSSPVGDLTVDTFPLTDCSDSTAPLRDILVFKLFGCPYAWERDGYAQYEWQHPWGISFGDYEYYTEHGIDKLKRRCLLNNNTHGAFEGLIDREVDFIITARGISRDESEYAESKGVEIMEKPIALDALAFIVNSNNPTTDITHEQIQQIYMGEITEWSEICDWERTITPYVRNANSGSQEKFETLVMEGKPIFDFPEFQIGITMLSPYYMLEYDETGLAYTPFYYWKVIVDNEATKCLGVNGVEMTGENIANGTYPFITYPYVAVRADIDKSSVAYRLYEFMTTPEGQDIVEEARYIPLYPTTGISQLNTIAPFTVKGNTCILSSEHSFRQLDIQNTQGIRVQSASHPEGEISLGGLTRGIYIIRLTLTSGKVISQKINIR